MPVEPVPPHVSGIDQQWPPRTRRLIGAALHLCDDWFHEPLRACMADFDARLHTGVRAATSLAEQKGFLATRARLVQDTETFEWRFVAVLHQSFAQLGQVTHDTPTTSAGPALSLLDSRAHELGSALEQMAQRCELQGGQVLVELGYRLAVLVAAPPLEGRAQPLSPQAMVAAFRRAAAPLELPAEHQLLLLQSFDQALMRHLAALQVAVNDLLQGDGILPRLRAFSVPRAPRRARAADRPAVDVAAAQAPLPEPAPRSPPAPRPAPAPVAVVAAVPRPVPAAAPPAIDTRTRDVPGPRQHVASDAQLQQALEALQWSLDGASDWRQLHAALVLQLNVGAAATGPTLHLSPQQAQAMAQVVHWFREAQGQLPRTSSTDSLLDGLHWPLLRMVLSDVPTCMQPGHPAYRLLRKVVEVVRDWLPGADGRDDPAVAAQLQESLRPLGEAVTDTALCLAVHDDLEQHLAHWRDKARIAERRHVEAMRGRERLERARRRAGELLAHRLANTTASGPLRALFDDAWADVLALALLRQGESSSLFTTLLVITDQLLGCLPAGDRQRLRQDVENGLQQIGLYGSEATRMAQALIDAGHVGDAGSSRRRLRRGEPSRPEPLAEEGAAPVAAPDPQLEARRRAVLARLRDARFGGWFEFVDGHGGPPLQRRLAWFSALSGRCLFVTRRGQRAEEMDLDQLARAIADGHVRELRTDADD